MSIEIDSQFLLGKRPVENKFNCTITIAFNGHTCSSILVKI